MSTNINVDRNLLFAVIALQDDLIDQAQFADVCAGWAVRLERPLADLLIDRRWITAQDRDDIERKLERKLKKNRGDLRATLAVVAEADARDTLRAIASPEVRQSLAALPPARGHVLVETLVPPPAERDSLRYTLTRLHAEGGLGKVWIAHDTDLNRDVALKEIKASANPNPESWRRFLKEAQITGQLEHPNIVPVYELARRKQDDQPFYTMRFLRGQTLRDAIAEFHRRRDGKPADRLELQRQLLEPFVKVCQAVGYAHSRGVIHRDLKPENVVLGGHGEVVVLDWGLAKVLGAPDEAGAGTPEPSISVSSEAETRETLGQVGTPAYMAPEQVEARGDLIDFRTDVYGLGAILFEILTGHPPALGASIGEVFSKIRAANLPRPRELEPTIPRPLEAICIKAIEHAPAKRYRRPEDLAEDVRRWLLDEPVSVHRDPIAVKLMRWGRRHRTLASSLGALLATAVVGLSLGLVLINQERSRTEGQRKIAVEQREIAVANAARAISNLRLAQDAADGLLAEVADVDLAEIPQMEPVRQRLLEKANLGYQKFLTQDGDDPLIRWGAARAKVRLGDIQALLGDAGQAGGSYRLAIKELDELTTQDPASVAYRRDLARGLLGEAILSKDANQFKQAEELARKAINLRAKIAESDESTGDDRQALADCRYQLGAILARSGTNAKENLAEYQAALGVQEALVKQFADQPRYLTKLARYRNNVAILQYASGHAADANATLRGTLESLAVAMKAAQVLPGVRWQVARSSNNLATLLMGEKNGEAKTYLTRAQALLQSLGAEFPSVVQYALELASVELNLGLIAKRGGFAEEAATHYKEAARLLEMLKRQFPKSPAYRMKLSVAEVAIAETLAPTAWDEAEVAINKALTEQTALNSEYPGVPEYERSLGRGHYQLAQLLVKRNSKEAILHSEQARALFAQVLRDRPDSERDRLALAENQVVLTLALISAGRISDAQVAAERTPEILPTAPAAYIHAAAQLIECAKAAASLDGGPLAEDSLARAVAVLRKAIAAKVIRAASSLDTRDLAPLRDRQDFKALRDSLVNSGSAG